MRRTAVMLGSAAAAAAAAIFTPAIGARAEQTPTPGVVDPRIRSVFYDPNQVVAIRGYFGYQMMIEFAPDERIENVSIGDGLAWQVTPNHKATLLFLKPLEAVAPTNMTVVTDQRRYAFELTARRPGKTALLDMAYVVRFIYPPPPPAPPAPPPPAPPERKNLAYTYTGSRALLPSLVFDDGRSTYFQWPSTATIPAVFLVGPDGAESIVNFSVRDGYFVVEQMAPKFDLRSAKELTVVINDAWRDPLIDAAAPRPHTPPKPKRHGMFGWLSGHARTAPDPAAASPQLQGSP